MFRIAPLTPLYRRVRIAPERDYGLRRPRQRSKEHLERIAALSCVVPGCHVRPVHVAHIRYACAADGADIVGKAMKPDDWRTLPLCPHHHLDGRRAQHRMNEEDFWASHGINPYALARALWNMNGDHDAMCFLVERAPLLFPSLRAG
jgi:hypothetical protein